MDDVSMVNGNQLSYAESMGMPGAGLNTLGGIDNNGQDGLMQGSLTNANISRKKKNGSPGRDESGKVKKTKSPKKRKKRDPNEPQNSSFQYYIQRKSGPVSAYAMFFRDTQASIKSSHPLSTFGEVSKIVASRWDQLDDESKTKYKTRTDLAKKEYLQKLAAYRASLVSTGVLDPTNMSSSSASDSSPRESPERTGNQSETHIHIVTANQQPLQLDHVQQPTIVSFNFEEDSAAAAATQAYSTTPMQPQQQLQQQQPVTSVRLQQVVNSNSTSATDHVMMVTSQDGGEVMTPLTGQDMAKEGEDNIQSSMPSNVFYGKIAAVGKSPSQSIDMLEARLCIRTGCGQKSVGSPQWNNEYCSNQCVVDHCKDVFTAWVASRSGYTPVN